MVVHHLHGLLIPDLLRQSLCCLSGSSVIPLGLLKMKETLLFSARLVFCWFNELNWHATGLSRAAARKRAETCGLGAWGTFLLVAEPLSKAAILYSHLCRLLSAVAPLNGLSVGPLQEMRLGNWSMLNSVQRKMGNFNLSQLPVVAWEMEFLSQLWKKPTRQSLFAEQCPTHVFMWASVVGIEAALGLLESPANPSLLGILLLNNCSLHPVLSGGVWPGLLRWSWAQANIPAKTGEKSQYVCFRS